MFKRREPKNEGALIADLDEIVQSTGRIKLHGKVHKVNPILVEEFFALSGALAKIKAIDGSKKVEAEELIEAYYDIIFPVIPSITKQDIRDCTHAQVAALLSAVVEHCTGGLTEEKKKALKAVMLPSSMTS